MSNITKTIKESVESLEEKIVYVPFDRHTCESWNDLGQEFIDHALPTNEFRQNLKSHLLQSQIRLIDSVIEEMKQQSSIFKFRTIDNEYKFQCKAYKKALEDQISSLEEVKKEILCMK